MINVYQLYIIQNYIGQSVKESAVTVSVVSMIDDGHVSGRLLHLRPGFRFHRPS